MGTIQDGTGRGYSARVTASNKLSTVGIHYPIQTHASLRDQRAFQAVSGVQSVTGAYGILALRNNGVTDVVVTYIRVGVDVVETSQALVEVLMGGVWVDGTAAPGPHNVNAGSTISAEVTSHYNTIPTTPNVIDNVWIAGPGEQVWKKEGSIVLPTSHHMALRVTPATAAVNVHARISFVTVDAADLEGI